MFVYDSEKRGSFVNALFLYRQLPSSIYVQGGTLCHSASLSLLSRMHLPCEKEEPEDTHSFLQDKEALCRDSTAETNRGKVYKLRTFTTFPRHRQESAKCRETLARARG
jgi:hypothetical protein